MKLNKKSKWPKHKLKHRYSFAYVYASFICVKGLTKTWVDVFLGHYNEPGVKKVILSEQQK